MCSLSIKQKCGGGRGLKLHGVRSAEWELRLHVILKAYPLGLYHPVTRYKLPVLPGKHPGLKSPLKRALGVLAKLDKYRHKEWGAAGKDGATPASGEDGPPSGDTTRILDAISLCQTTLTSKIEEVKVDISLIHQDIHKLRERVSKTERRWKTTSRHYRSPPNGSSTNSMLSLPSRTTWKQRWASVLTGFSNKVWVGCTHWLSKSVFVGCTHWGFEVSVLTGSSTKFEVRVLTGSPTVCCGCTFPR